MRPFRPTIPYLTESSSSHLNGHAPNRLTSVFARMKATCPDAIRVYGTCIANQHANGSLEKGKCDAEFDAVKECFRQSRQ